MQFHSFEIAIERDRRDAFVTASQAYVDSTLAPLYHGHLPSVVPLRMTRGDGTDVYVGCLVQRPHREQKMKLLCSLALAADLGLKAGEQVSCTPLPRAPPHATKVLVAPVTVDDSEVVEQNAVRIEMELLRQVQVVFPGQRITVAIYAGVHATVQVQRIECGPSGEELTKGGGCAVMNEGTHFIVATRMRQAAQADTEDSESDAAVAKKCTWAFLRARPPRPEEDTWAKEQQRQQQQHGSKAALPSYIVASARTAARLGWTADRVYQVLDMASLAGLEKPEIAPSFLRSDAVVLSRLLIRPEEEGPEGASDDETVVAPHLTQATNLLVLPSSEREVQQQKQQQQAENETEGEAANPVHRTVTHDADVLPQDLPSLEALEAVHGAVPGDLLEYLSFAFTKGQMLSPPRTARMAQVEPEHMSHNVLLCGGKGYGKTTVVRSVLHHMRGQVHTVLLECVTGKHFLPRLRRALLECALCAPSVLVLDGFDTIAAEQKEGNVQAMTAATRATLEAAVTTLTRVFSFAGVQGVGGPIVVIGTCASRESVNEALRSAWCFQKILALNALTRVTRGVLLSQLFPAPVTADEVRRMSAFMDNYTPFDVCQIAKRIRNAVAAVRTTDRTDSADAAPSIVESTEKVAATFTPLAHAGIKFLKGDKLDWESIGGLTEAKKVLFDTLVLPMRHPKLFAKLPLKTRSGILLYGASGCGKTFILESLVKAENINCIVVNGPEVFGKYIGQSEQKIRDVFERAAAAAPCVVFFDEFDSVAPQRGVDNSGVTDRVVNQLLCYLDGVEGRKDVYVVAASSRPDLIDAALLRPGRLDKAVQCPVPSHADRVAILRHQLRKTTTASDVADAVVEKIATDTENWTPADLSAVVSTANMLVNQRVMDTIAAAAAARSAGEEQQEGSSRAQRRLGEENTEAYYIANIGAGVSRDKVLDSLKAVLDKEGSSSDHATLLLENKMTEGDLMQAMASTRPSLSAKDLATQKRIHALFGKGEPAPVPSPGTKLTFS